MENYEIVWNSALGHIENTVSTISYSTFIKTLTPVDVSDSQLVLIAPTETFANEVSEGILHDKIVAALNSVSSEINDFKVVVAKSKLDYISSSSKSDSSQITGSPINSKFTFESFVVGESNKLIYAAATAVAETPGDAYNPLFIYGGTGLGKTHILMAIANYIKLHQPSLKVLYVTCEQFTNQFIDSIQHGNIKSSDFRNMYRNVDVLLVDDIQFISNKEQTQSEFFYTFNELISRGKQVVLTSDKPPKEMKLLEERLRTRFEGGLLVDVQIPDLETKIAILKKKAEEKKCIIDINVLTYIAENHNEDTRSLIGKLTKIIFASKLHERPITIDLVNDAIKECSAVTKEDLEADDIISCVCNYYKITKNDLLGKRKNKEFVEPRQICTYLITELMNLPLETVGEKMGGRDHATVIYTRDKVSELIKTNPKIATEVNDLKNLVLHK